MGLMAGLGFITSVHKNQFATHFFAEADGSSVFKLDKSDTSYTDRISVPAIRQKLVLLKRPVFDAGEIITGSFEGQFRRFYESYTAAEEPLTRNYNAKFYFICRLALED